MSRREQCNEAVVRAMLDEAAEVERLSERRARDGLRQVSLLDGRYVLKRFELAAGTAAGRKPWRREHAALTYLADPQLPVSYGYVEDLVDGRRVIRYLRAYVSGEPLEGFDRSSAAEAGALLAALHTRRLVTDDALTQNFMRAGDGRLFFLDFGKSRIFAAGNPLLAVWIALEHCRFLRASLAGDRALWAVFRDAYFRAVSFGRPYRITIRLLTRLLLWQRRLRRSRARR